ncbi:hypothetical protein DM75_3366 [Burkholderia mallei]|nr:hypothetical protein DM75_3366 [Burkholderia mallei]
MNGAPAGEKARMTRRTSAPARAAAHSIVRDVGGMRASAVANGWRRPPRAAHPTACATSIAEVAMGVVTDAVAPCRCARDGAAKAACTIAERLSGGSRPAAPAFAGAPPRRRPVSTNRDMPPAPEIGIAAPANAGRTRVAARHPAHPAHPAAAG